MSFAATLTTDRISDHPAALAPHSMRPAATGTLFQTLVVSADASRRKMLATAAGVSGWEAVECGDSGTAAGCMSWMCVQLAIVDMQGAPSNFRSLVEKLARAPGVLLMVCGSEENAQEELWARQLGVWLYLPGVNAESDVASLCDEAREVGERLATAAKGKSKKGIHCRRSKRVNW